MVFFDIQHRKSSNAMLVTRPKNILKRNIRPFLASESGKRYSANVSYWMKSIPGILFMAAGK